MTDRVLRGATAAVQLRDAMAGAATPDWLAQQGRVLKRDGHSLVALVEIEGRSTYLKYFAAKHAWQGIGFRLGVGRAVRAFDAGQWLLQRGIPVPEPLGCLLRRDGMLLATEGLVGARDMKAIWLDTDDLTLRRNLLADAAALLSRLHSAGFAHGDCKWANLLCRTEHTYLVDLEAVARCPEGDQRQARDLARFTVNAEDLGVDDAAYGLFLQRYCRGVGRDQAAVLAGLRPQLARFRARHLRKYGERGSRLL